MRNRLIRDLLILLVALFIGASAFAQDVEAPSPLPATVPPAETAPGFIPLAQIPEASESLQQNLRRLVAMASADPAIVAIKEELPAIRESAARRLDHTNLVLEGNPTLARLGDIERDWTVRLRELSSRRQTLARRATGLENEVVAMVAAQGLWQRTLEKARESEAPGGVIAVIESNSAAIEEASKQLRARRGSVLTLLTAVSERELTVTEALERISNVRVELRARLLEPDSDPLWVALWEADPVSRAEQVREAAKVNWAQLVGFAERRARALVPLAVGFFAILVIAVYARDRLRRRVEKGVLEGSATVFERPISVAVVCVALIGGAALPFAPESARDAVGLIILVPILRLLIPLLPKTARTVLGLLAAFYLVDRLRAFIAPAELFERTIFGLEMVVASIVVWVLLRPRRLATVPTDAPYLPFLGIALRASLLAFVVAAVANLLGYVAFAKLVGGGALSSIYLALLAYAAYRISSTLVLLAVTSSRVQGSGTLRANSGMIMSWSRRTLSVLATGFWVLGTFESFEIRDILLSAIDTILSTPIEIGTISVSVGSVLAFPLTIFLAFAISRAIQVVLSEDVFPRVSLRRGVGNAISTTIHYGLLMGGFFLALGAAGIDLSKFALLAGALGVGIGFGLQNVVNNFVSGLILLYERPVQVGDNIEVAGLLGEVKRIGIRASTIQTFQGAEVIIPNGNLLSDQLINWTLSNRHRRVELPVGVAYGNRPADVIAILERVVEREERILSDPAPTVLFRGFGDSSLDFEVRFWVRDYMTYLVLASDVASAIYDELETEGITIPFPQRDLHLKSIDSDVARNLRGGRDE